MAVSILIEDFVGDTKRFYDLVVEEVNRRGMPGVEYGWTPVTEKAGTLLDWDRGESTHALQVKCATCNMSVLAYQFGRCFLVRSGTLYEPNWENKAGLFSLTISIVSEVVDRSAQAALKRLMEEQNAPLPVQLKPENIFIVDPSD